tara:strand:- start:21439 stop:22191 length:753 start_codon:yes stop_codon:yes gene_type:complete
MLKKRLVGVVTVKNGWAVQSFGYKRYLPLGKPEILVENLDRWGVDEILLQSIDRSIGNLGPDFELLERVARKGIATPLIYGGGISSLAEGVNVIKAGADRIVIDALLRESQDVVISLSERLGAQALIAALPLSLNNDQLEWLDYRTGKSDLITDQTSNLFDPSIISEMFIIDWRNEGQANAFDTNLLLAKKLPKLPIIAFGGLNDNERICWALEQSKVVAVALGNFLNYQEHSVHIIKHSLGSRAPLRIL